MAIKICRGLLLIVLALQVGGCASLGDQIVAAFASPTKDPDRWAAFRAAGPVKPILSLEPEELEVATRPLARYRVVVGDLLLLDMPEVLATIRGTVESLAALNDRTLRARVQLKGEIVLPLIGRVNVEGMTLLEIERDIIERYGQFLKREPVVVVELAEAQTFPVKVEGGVSRPGVYHLRHDQMSVVSLLAAAGGISQAGANLLSVSRTDEPEDDILVPIEDGNIPEVDLALKPGDQVTVNVLPPQRFTVIGLVRRPGLYDYPPNTVFNVQEAIAQAGGLRSIADPPHAVVYRMTEDEKLVFVRVRVAGTDLIEAARVRLKPGDIVAVEESIYTSTRLLIASILRVGVGVGANVDLLDDNDNNF